MGVSLYQSELIDRSGSLEARYRLGRKFMRELTQVAVYEYDFAVEGGATGAHTLRSLDGEQIPDNAVIVRGFVDVLTTLTTAGSDAGTIALSVESADDIVAAIAVSNAANAWDAGLQDVVPDGTAANMVKTDSKVDVVATIATQAVTAGKFKVYLEYIVSE